jgi:hypothetical protein
VFHRLLLMASLALVLEAQDRWTAVKYGPFEVFSNSGDRIAREKLMYLEQFREALRVITGKEELRMVWPIRVLVFKNAKQMPAAGAPFALGRDARMLAITESGGLSRDILKELARILLYENTTRLPPEIEQGLIELVSTLEIGGPRITVGAPVPVAERTHGWALMQMVTVNPEYSGRSRVMVSNLEQSGDFEAACRNAFEKGAAEINQKADAYLKAGNFATGTISGRAVSMDRDFRLEKLDRDDGPLALADLALAGGSAEAEKAYSGLSGAAAAEGQGLLALKRDKPSEARELFESATNSASASARAWLELGKLEADEATARADLKKAAELSPHWAEPYYWMADIEIDNFEQRAVQLKKAAALDPRNLDYWQALAKTEILARNYPEAEKAWAGAERAAPNDQERARIHQTILQMDKDRIDFEQAERKRIAAEREQDLARVKGQSDAAIRAAEDEARKRLNPNGAAPPTNAVWMDELKSNTAVDGAFERLDCIGHDARMVIKTDDGKSVQLLVHDPGKIVLSGGGETTFGCGVQSSGRRVHVEYQGKPDAKLKTIGDVTTIEFR